MSSASRTAFPPLEETLAGRSAVPPPRDLTATMGREALSDTLAAPSVLRPPVSLPALPLALDDEASPLAGAGSTDLRLVGTLGQGGMGVVHLAEQRSLDRAVALKIPHADAPPHVEAALVEEARVTGRLEHPNIVPVHALGRTADGRPVMVMKRVEGVSLRTLLDDETHPHWALLPEHDRLVALLEVLLGVGNALSFAHSRGVVHRDVKPDNILVGAYGEVVLLDFGLAVERGRARTATGIVGTPVYMAPEMIAGFEVDARTDVYLLGATLHEVLTGAPPHRGESLPEVLSRAYLSEPPVYPDSVPEELAAITRRALARDPADRFEDVRAFRDAIRDFLTHRASHQLAGRARSLLAEVPPPDDVAAARAALAEVRFACRQAIELWADNAAARATLRDARLATAAVEVAARNPVAARGALAGIADVPAQLEADVAALERAAAVERAEAERLRALEHDLDATLGAAARRRAMLVLAAFGGTISVFVIRRNLSGPLRAQDLLPIAFVMFLVVTTLLVVFWRAIARNAFGRKLALVGWSVNVVMCLHRLVGAFTDEPVHRVLAGDLVLFAGVLAATGILVDLRFLVVLPILLAGAFVAAVEPALAPPAFSGSTVIAMLLAAVYFGRRGEDGAGGASGASGAGGDRGQGGAAS